MKNTFFKHSLPVKLALIALLVLLLQIPVSVVTELITGRTGAKSDAEVDIARIAGKRQSIGAPVLTVPYLVRTIEHHEKKLRERVTKKYATLTPDTAKVTGSIAVESWYRGVFEIPTYVATLTIDGRFSPARLQPEVASAADILWNEAVITMGISDAHALREDTAFEWNGAALALEGDGKVIMTKLPSLADSIKHPQSYKLRVSVGGTSSIYFAPVAQSTEVDLTSPWQFPTFVGSYLPLAHSVTGDGFSAHWQVSALARSLAALSYESSASFLEPFPYEAVFGVDLFAPVDIHRMIGRAIQYQLLFIFLTFMLFILFEVLYELRTHPMQYLLIGAALVLFYLLLLGLCDHLSFPLAYLISTVCAFLLIVGYSCSVLGERSLTWFVSGTLAFLYGFLYSLLNIENYAFLIGAVGLMAILGLTMYCTRNIDWYKTFAHSRQKFLEN